MKKLILVHGSGGTGASHWNPYVVTAMQQTGWEVLAPDFPNPNDPQLEEWLAALPAGTLTPETVLVGHSLGCPFIMSLLERSDVSIKKVIAVAGLYDKARFPELAFLQDSYDWEAIKTKAQSFYFIHSTNDPWNCDEAEADFAFTHLGGTKIMMTDQGHFGSEKFDNPYPEFPLLVKLIAE